MKISAVQNKLKSFPAAFPKPQSYSIFFGLDLIILYLSYNTIESFIFIL